MEQTASSRRQKLSAFAARFTYLTVTTLIALAATVAALPAREASAFNLIAAPRVTFTFDDGLASTLTQAAPALDAFGYDGTTYVITGCVGTVGTCPAEETHVYMTWDQIASLAAQGWEIGSHSVTHPLLASTDPEIQTTDLTDAQEIAELADSKKALNDHGYPALAFAAPYGDYDSFVRSEAAKLYTSFRGYKDVNINGFPYNDYLIYVQVVEGATTVATVKGYIDAAKAANAWLVLVFHDVQPQATLAQHPDEYATPTEDLTAIAQYVHDQNIDVTTLSGALVEGTDNLLPTGGFEGTAALGVYSGTPSATEWTTTDPTNIKIDTTGKGSYPDATTSVAIASGTANNYLYSPLVAVDPTQTYVLKSYLYVDTVTSGELGYYVHEYDTAGTEVSGQWKKAETSVFVDEMNFTYVPTSASVAQACLEVYTVANSGISAHVDNFQWFMAKPDYLLIKLGDVNGDGVVDALDLGTVLTNWGTGTLLSQGEINGDGVVDALDLSTVLTNWSI